MKVKLKKILGGILLAGSLSAVGGTASAAPWIWTGTIQDWLDAGSILDGDGDARFTYGASFGSPIENANRSSQVEIFENEISGIDYYSVEFSHPEGALYLDEGQIFQYSMEVLPPADERIRYVALAGLTTGGFGVDVAKDILDQAGKALANLSIVGEQGSTAFTAIGSQVLVYATDTVGNGTTETIGNSYIVSPVPEIDALAGTGALSLLGGFMALAGERRRRTLKFSPMA